MTIDAALSRRLLALCLHLCGNAADAEDALQETLLALHVGRFRGESTIDTFAYRVALRISLRIKARSRLGNPMTVEPAGSGAGPIEAAADASKVLRAMSRLPADQRAVLSLFSGPHSMVPITSIFRLHSIIRPPVFPTRSKTVRQGRDRLDDGHGRGTATASSGSRPARCNPVTDTGRPRAGSRFRR